MCFSGLLSVELGPLFSVHSRILRTLYVWQQRTGLGWALMSLPLHLSLTFLCLWLVTWEMAATLWRMFHGWGLTPRLQVSWLVVQRCQPSTKWPYSLDHIHQLETYSRPLANHMWGFCAEPITSFATDSSLGRKLLFPKLWRRVKHKCLPLRLYRIHSRKSWNQ